MQEKKITQIKASEVLYLSFFVLMLVAKGVGLYDGQVLYKLFFLSGMGLLGVKFCITEHTLKEWIIIMGVSLLMILVYLNCKEKGILICTLTVLAMKGVSVDRVFKVGMWTWGISMWANVVYHLLNLDASGYKVHEKLGLGHIFRWDLGFSHPNVLHISYLVFCGFVIYNLDKKYNWKYAFGLMTGNLFVFLYSVSYTGIIVVTLYILLSLYVNMRQNLSKLEYGLLELVFPGAVLLSLLSPILLPEQIFNILNKIFSNRLILAEYYLVPENMKLLGNNLADITTHILTMDNAYVFSIVIYGIVYFAVIVISYMLLVHICAKGQKKKELALIVCFVIAGITEPFLFNTSFKNLSLIFLGDSIFNNYQNGIEKKEGWGIFLKWDKSFMIEDTKWNSLQRKIVEVVKKNKKSIALLSITLGIIAGILVGTRIKMPTAYIVPRIHVDIESDETWYIEDVNEAVYQDMKILDYQDAQTRMQILEGNIITMEYMRGCISGMIVTAFVTGIICTGGMIVKESLNKQN